MSIKKKQLKAISLEHLDEEIIDNIRIWRNQDFVRKNMLEQHIISKEEHLRYIETIKKNDNRGLYVFYLDEEPFGVYQYQINRERNSVSNGFYLIHEDDQYLGYGVIAYYIIGWIQYKILGVRIVENKVISYNKEALALQKKLKSKLIGIDKDAIEFEGNFYDIYNYEEYLYPPDPNGKWGKIVFEIINEEFDVI